MELNELIEKVKNTKDYENLSEILGSELGDLLYTIIEQANDLYLENKITKKHLRNARIEISLLKLK